MSAITSAVHEPHLLHRMLAHLPAAAYTCSPDGLITWFNARAAELWGRTPKLNDPADRYCGSFRLFNTEGQPIEHAACWMAMAIRDRREYLAQEIVVERPDGSRATVLAYATPILDEAGNIASAMNMLVDISERKHFEDLVRRASHDNDLYRATLADALREELQPMETEIAMLATGFPEDPAVAGHAARLRAQLERITALIDDMVDVAPR